MARRLALSRWLLMLMLPPAFLLASCGDGDDASDEAFDTTTDLAADTATVRQLAPQDSMTTMEVRVNDSLPPFLFQFHPQDSGRAIAWIEITREGRDVQRLDSLGMKPGTIDSGSDASSYFTVKDLNFDGYMDLQLMTSKSDDTRRFRYWMFDPQRGAWQIDPVLANEQGSSWPKEADGLVMFFTNEGCDGRCYTRNTYRIVDSTSSFVLVRQETQQSTSRASQEGGRFLRTLKEMKDGKLQVTERKTLDGSEAM